MMNKIIYLETWIDKKILLSELETSMMQVETSAWVSMTSADATQKNLRENRDGIKVHAVPVVCWVTSVTYQTENEGIMTDKEVINRINRMANQEWFQETTASLFHTVQVYTCPDCEHKTHIWFQPPKTWKEWIAFADLCIQ